MILNDLKTNMVEKKTKKFIILFFFNANPKCHRFIPDFFTKSKLIMDLEWNTHSGLIIFSAT